MFPVAIGLRHAVSTESNRLLAPWSCDRPGRQTLQPFLPLHSLPLPFLPHLLSSSPKAAEDERLPENYSSSTLLPNRSYEVILNDSLNCKPAVLMVLNIAHPKSGAGREEKRRVFCWENNSQYKLSRHRSAGPSAPLAPHAGYDSYT